MNIRYPLYEGVYRILTLIRTLARSRRTLFPSTPNARTSLERAFRALSILFRLYLLLTMP